MSERTTIGGTVYEAIGSSSSNLLLRCNGTARIQWGGKLIDLIKNGKIASEDSQELIFIVDDESKVKNDGIYILTTEESSQLCIYKDGNKYDFTSPNIYIQTNTKQDFTVEQKSQALENIGIQYNTLQELQQAGIKNGIAYVIENKTIYTIKDSLIEEFTGKLKTITVTNESSNNSSNDINSTSRVVLSVLDDQYLILSDQRISSNYSLYLNNSAQLGSDGSDSTQGYRLYNNNGIAFLDIDKVNVRKSLIFEQNKEITLSDIYFSRGMIMMHSGITPIPEGWAVCDGSEHTFNGVTSKTPDLRNKFIKAVATASEVNNNNNPDLNENNEFILSEQHLPKHNHPHQKHAHTFSGNGSDSISSTFYALTNAEPVTAVLKVEGGDSGDAGHSTSGKDITVSDTVTINISGTTSDVTSTETEKTWENKSFKVEPHYYSLIFIMKL